jgi:hypothetical protein
LDTVANGVRVFDILGNGATTIHGSGLSVSGGWSVLDSGATITAQGGMIVVEQADAGAVNTHAVSSTFSHTLQLFRADRAANSAFFLQKLTSDGANMFTVRAESDATMKMERVSLWRLVRRCAGMVSRGPWVPQASDPL